MMKHSAWLTALAIVFAFSVNAQEASKKYVNGFLNELEKGLESGGSLSQARYYIENGLLPENFDWESIFVMASHAPKKPGGSLGQPREVEFFKRGPHVHRLLSDIRALDLSRNDLVCLRSSRGRPNSAQHVPLTIESMDKLTKSCGLLEVTLNGITTVDSFELLAKWGADLNASSGKGSLSGLAPIVVLKSVVPNEAQRRTQGINELSGLKKIINFDQKYAHSFNRHISGGVRMVTKSTNGFDYSDHLTSQLDFMQGDSLVATYCRIAEKDIFAGYKPNFPALRYFLENDRGFKRRIELARGMQPGDACYKFVRKLLKDPNEYAELRDAALTSGNIAFMQRFDALFGKKKVTEPSPVKEANTPELKSGSNVTLWASRVEGFSSQYDTAGWSAKQALGPRNIMKCGDIEGSWAAKEANGGREYIKVGFAQNIVPSQIKIYQNNEVGFVRTILFTNVDGTTDRIRVKDGTTTCPGTLTVQTKGYEKAISMITVMVDGRHKAGYEEIDAVSVTGIVE